MRKLLLGLLIAALIPYTAMLGQTWIKASDSYVRNAVVQLQSEEGKCTGVQVVMPASQKIDWWLMVLLLPRSWLHPQLMDLSLQELAFSFLGNNYEPGNCKASIPRHQHLDQRSISWKQGVFNSLFAI